MPDAPTLNGTPNGLTAQAGRAIPQGMDNASFLTRLEATIAERSSGDPSVSYVARLNAKGIAKIAQKVGEEGVETVIAAMADDRAGLIGEAADLIFHLLVLLNAKDVSLSDVLAELARREGTSGIAEKAARADK